MNTKDSAPDRLRVQPHDTSTFERILTKASEHVNSGILFSDFFKIELETKSQSKINTLTADEAAKTVALFLEEHTKTPGNDNVFKFWPMVQKLARQMGIPQDILLRGRFYADCEGQSVSACALWKVIQKDNPALKESKMAVVTIGIDGSDRYKHPDFAFFPISLHSFNLLIGDRKDWKTFQPYDFLNYPPNYVDAVNTNQPGLLPFIIAQFGEQIGISSPLEAAKECATELLKKCPVERFVSEAFQYAPFDGQTIRNHGFGSVAEYLQLENIMSAILFKNYDDKNAAIKEIMEILPKDMPDEVKLLFIMQSKPLQSAPRLSNTPVNKAFQEPLTAKAIQLINEQLAGTAPINQEVWQNIWLFSRDFLNAKENTLLREFLNIDTSNSSS